MATLSKESDKRVRDMLCLHQMFRRSPGILFSNPDGKLWDDYIVAVKAVKDDPELNMDYQWEKDFSGMKVRAEALAGEVRPHNPRIEEAYNMLSLRPSVKDMEQDTEIYRNAVKERPTVSPREAMYAACKEIYVAIDRDVYFFVDAIDKYYGTGYVKGSLDVIRKTKNENKEYCAATEYLARIEEKGLDGIRKTVFEQELAAYSAAIKMNRILHEAKYKSKNHVPVVLKEYKGIDISWADKRLPSDKAVEDKFIQGLSNLLSDAAVSAAMKGDKTRRYEALLDKVESADILERKSILSVHAADILYGFGYVNLKEGKYVAYNKSKLKPQERQAAVAGKER